MSPGYSAPPCKTVRMRVNSDKMGGPDEGLEVRRSLPKLAAWTLVFSPFIFLVITLPLWSVRQLLEGNVDGVLHMWAAPIGWIFLLAAFALWRLGEICYEFGRTGIFLKLTPEGLIMPSLGSCKPIPWSEIQTQQASGWLDLVVYFDVTADPKEYPFLFGRTPMVRWTRRPRVWIYAALNVSISRILTMIREYQRQAGHGSTITP